MKHTTAQFWANTINALMAGHKVIFIDVRQYQNWKPDSDIATLNGAKAFAYDHAPGDGHFHITSSYGVHEGLESVEIHPNDREIVMYSDTAACGQACWRVIRDLDYTGDNWQAWLAAEQESWQMARRQA